jgi:hypothetical protein
MHVTIDPAENGFIVTHQFIENAGTFNATGRTVKYIAHDAHQAGETVRRLLSAKPCPELAATEHGWPVNPHEWTATEHAAGSGPVRELQEVTERALTGCGFKGCLCCSSKEQTNG